LSYRSWAAWYLGYPEAALTEADHALEDAREIGQAATMMVALACAAWTRKLCRRFAAAGSLADELVELADEKGGAYWKALGTMMQGDLLAVMGEGSVAIQKITSGVTAQRSTGATVLIPSFLSSLARAYADLGRFDDTWRYIDEALAAVESTKEKLFEAEIRRFAGEIALLSPKPDAEKAKAHFERALSVARQQQAKSLELRAAMSLARLWRDQGKPQQARELLAPVYAWFTEVRHARSERGEGVAGGIGVMNTSQYAFADRAQEQRRLPSQAELLDPLTERVFRAAGLENGMRVLDLGSDASRAGGEPTKAQRRKTATGKSRIAQKAGRHHGASDAARN
jgi:predicted ATPase